MNELENARANIDRIDREMAELFEERMRCCADIAAFKKTNGLPIRDRNRERELLKRNLSFVRDETIRQYYAEFLQNNIELSCDYQSRLIDGVCEADE